MTSSNQVQSRALLLWLLVGLLPDERQDNASLLNADVHKTVHAKPCFSLDLHCIAFLVICGELDIETVRDRPDAQTVAPRCKRLHLLDLRILRKCPIAGSLFFRGQLDRDKEKSALLLRRQRIGLNSELNLRENALVGFRLIAAGQIDGDRIGPERMDCE